MWKHSAMIYVMLLEVVLKFKFGSKDKSSNLQAEIHGSNLRRDKACNWWLS
jgi:hypothetical protein